MVFFLYGKVLYQYKLYDKFDTAPPKVTATVMLVLAVLQIVLMVGKTDRSQIIGGYLLICSGFIWFMYTGVGKMVYGLFPMNAKMAGCSRLFPVGGEFFQEKAKIF